MDRLTEIISLLEPRELRDAPVQMRSLPNKERRVQAVVAAAARRPVRARELVEAILTQLRVADIFDAERAGYDQDAVRAERAGCTGSAGSSMTLGTFLPSASPTWPRGAGVPLTSSWTGFVAPLTTRGAADRDGEGPAGGSRQVRPRGTQRAVQPEG